jgi:hypothetical protein
MMLSRIYHFIATHIHQAKPENASGNTPEKSPGKIRL